MVAPAPPSPEPAIVGADAALAALREAIVWPRLYAAEAAWLGVAWPRGVLLHGPPGCGKSALVRAVACEAGAVLHVITPADVFGAYAGESESRLRAAFAAADADAANGHPAVIVLEDADVLCPRRDGRMQHEARLVAQLLTLLDGVASSASGGEAPESVTPRPVVVAITTRPGAIDRALRRPGRLDAEVSVPPPGVAARARILAVHAAALPLDRDSVDLESVAAECVGYSGADLAALCREAAMAAVRETAAKTAGKNAGKSAGGGDSAPPLVLGAHFSAAKSRVGASLIRGSAAAVILGEPEIPGTDPWARIAGLEDVKRRLRQALEWPLRRAAACEALGVAAPRGVLLHGPPGCCKTTLARAAATTAGATLLSLSGAQLFSMYVGEGEALLRLTFAQARAAAPAIVFLDEIEGIAGRRAASGAPGGGGDATAGRLLSTLLTELDGLDTAPGGGGVLLLGATNRPRMLDAAILRPGRLDVHLFVPPPDESGRLGALRVHTRHTPLADDVSLPEFAAATAGCTGAELESLCRESALRALRDDSAAAAVGMRHFWAALEASGAPALSQAALAAYASFGGRR